ncbi:hypothetical protein PM082_000270 [Marasmius tenuissimus]|nr:hypothetical protein PM082_000270 [Marasmius tenuissimus]
MTEEAALQPTDKSPKSRCSLDATATWRRPYGWLVVLYPLRVASSSSLHCTSAVSLRHCEYRHECGGRNVLWRSNHERV